MCATNPEYQISCSLRLRQHGWLRRTMMYEAVCWRGNKQQVIKRSMPLSRSDDAGVFVRALMGVVDDLRADGWEPIGGPSDPGRGVLSRYSRPVRLSSS